MPTTIVFRGRFDSRTKRWIDRDDPDATHRSAMWRFAVLALIGMIAIVLHLWWSDGATVASVSDSAFMSLLGP